MAKTRNANYRSGGAVDFYFAPTGGEQFARTDVAVVAKALDDHDHSNGLGLSVARVANNAVGTTALVDLAVTGGKIANTTITGSKLVNNTITDTQLDAPRVLRAGDTMTGELTISRSGVDHTSNGLYDNAQIVIKETGGASYVAALGFNRDGVEGAGLYYRLGDFYYRTSGGTVGKLYSDQNFSVGSTFTIGMMLYWDQAASIPSGWTEVTAARGRFIAGANGSAGANPSGIAYAFDATGGVVTVNLQHGHTVTNHSHGINTESGSTETLQSPSDENRVFVGGHSHGGSTQGAAPGTDVMLSTTQSVLNPYIAKTFIKYTG